MLKVAREKQLTLYKRNPIRLPDLSPGTLQDRREWHDLFKVLKGKNCQIRILYPARLLFRIDRD